MVELTTEERAIVVKMRMVERMLIVVAGIILIILGYDLFIREIDILQGEIQANGIVLKNFSPGIGFAGLGVAILIYVMATRINLGVDNIQVLRRGSESHAQRIDETPIPTEADAIGAQEGTDVAERPLDGLYD